MSVNIRQGSRLFFSELKLIDGFEFWDTVDLPVYRKRRGDISHVVMSNDRIDRLAQRYYQDCVLWWVIAWANDMEILPTDLREGETIVIPDINYVKTRLFSRKTTV